MSRMKKATARASRRYKDVNVVLDGALAQEREELVRAVMKAPAAQRLTEANTSAEKALAQWDDAHRDAVLTIRVHGCIGSEWKALQLRNPVAKNEKDRSPGSVAFGFDIVGASVDALIQWGAVVDGEETETPTESEWLEFFEAVSPGDMAMLTRAVAEMNGTDSATLFGDLVKA